MTATDDNDGGRWGGEDEGKMDGGPRTRWDCVREQAGGMALIGVALSDSAQLNLKMQMPSAQDLLWFCTSPDLEGH